MAIKKKSVKKKPVKKVSKEILSKKTDKNPIGVQPEIPRNINGEPKRTPNGVRAYWIITIQDINQILFRGTADQCRIESNRLYSLYNQKHRTNTRYADNEEIKQNKPLRPTKNIEMVRLFKPEVTFASAIKQMGLTLTAEEAKIIKDKSDARDRKNAKISTTNKETYKRDNEAAWEKLRQQNINLRKQRDIEVKEQTKTVKEEALKKIQELQSQKYALGKQQESTPIKTTPKRKISGQDRADILSVKKDKGESLKSRPKPSKVGKKKKQ